MSTRLKTDKLVASPLLYPMATSRFLFILAWLAETNVPASDVRTAKIDKSCTIATRCNVRRVATVSDCAAKTVVGVKIEVGDRRRGVPRTCIEIKGYS